MKIYNTSLYEKLKIRPVNINDINDIKPDEPLLSIKIPKKSPADFRVDFFHNDIQPGYLVKTIGDDSVEDPDVWIYVDHENMKRLNKTYRMNNGYNGAIVRCYPDTKPDRPSRVFFMDFSAYKENWPKHQYYFEYDITDVWTTDIDLREFKTQDELADFYVDNKLKELR